MSACIPVEKAEMSQVRVSPEDLLRQAVHLRQQAYYDSALVSLTSALAVFRARRDSARVVESLIEAAYSLALAGEAVSAQDSLAATQTVGQEYMTAGVRTNIALVTALLSLHRGQFSLASATASESAALALDEANYSGLLMASCYRSWADRELGDYIDAARMVQRLLESLPDSMAAQLPAERAYCLNQLGQAYWHQGEWTKAEDALTEAMRLRSSVFGDMSVLTTATGSNLANVLFRRQDYEDALKLYFNDLQAQLSRYGAESEGVARCYSNIGLVYWRLGRLRMAVEYLERSKALRLRLQGETHPYVHINYNRLGLVYAELGDIHEALQSHKQSLGAKVRIHGLHHPEVAHAYNNIGVLYGKLGQHDSALVFHEKTRLLREETATIHPDVATTYHNLADARFALGETKKAIQYHKKGLAINKSVIGDPHRGVVNSHIQLANIFLSIGERVDAKAHLDSAFAMLPIVTLAEGPAPRLLPPDVLRAIELRATMYALEDSPAGWRSADSLYQALFKTLIRIRTFHDSDFNDTGKQLRRVSQYAFQNAESLLRATADSLYLRRMFEYSETTRISDLRSGIHAQTSLANAGIPDQTKSRLDSLRDAILHHGRAWFGGDRDEDDQLPSASPIGDLRLQYDQLLRRVEDEHPTYHAIRYGGDILDANAVARDLSGDEALLEFYYTRDSLYTFTITNTEWRYSSIPRAPVDRAISELVHSLSGHRYATYVASATSLYRYLVGPSEHIIQDRDLIVVPDGPLHQLPFEALLYQEPTSSVGDVDFSYSELPYVIRRHAISYSYSATLRSILRRRNPPSGSGRFLGIAPTKYDRDGPADSVQRNRPDHPSLPGANLEIRRLYNLFSPAYNPLLRMVDDRSMILLGREATEESLQEMNLSRFRYIHFATHGIVNDSIPELSGLLMHPSSSEFDDILHLGEIYSMDLDADLIVLSACDTGRGKNISGEGVVGLTGAFLYAGARNLVVSLWQVDDRAVSDLMVPFYTGFLQRESYREALRDSKLRMINAGGRRARPHYWAPFILFDS